MKPCMKHALLLLIVGAVAAIASCGFGFADDSGSATPAEWWSWQCSNGGTVSLDGGCSPIGDSGSNADG
jgi:hypothetical protein